VPIEIKYIWMPDLNGRLPPPSSFCRPHIVFPHRPGPTSSVVPLVHFRMVFSSLSMVTEVVAAYNETWGCSCSIFHQSDLAWYARGCAREVRRRDSREVVSCGIELGDRLIFLLPLSARNLVAYVVKRFTSNVASQTRPSCPKNKALYLCTIATNTNFAFVGK
jgi:hypothetical protein